MIKTLIQKQLLETFQSYFINNKTGKARSKKGTVMFIGLFALILIGLGFAFYSMAAGLGAGILGQGINWLYFALMGLLAMALGVFGSVFNTYASVYLPKDNEMLMALPIPDKSLLLARLSGVYFMSLLYSAWIWIPICIAYWVIVPATVTNVLFPVLLTFILALFVFVLSCILGLVVAFIATKAKGKSFLTVFLSLGVGALYYFVYFKIVDSLGEVLNHLEELSEMVKSWLGFVYILGKAADGDILSMILFTAVTGILAVGCFLLLLKSFHRIALQKGPVSKEKKAELSFASKKKETSLVLRELNHFISIPTWMLNGGFGLLIFLIAAVMLLIKSDSIGILLLTLKLQIPVLFEALPVILLSGICMIIATNAILTVSISIEGNTLWILKSLPLDAWDILRTKEKMGLYLCVVPAMLFVLSAGAVMDFEWLHIILLVATVLVFILLNGDFALFLNLKMPNFDWTNEAWVTKQSAPVVINMFGGWAFSALLGLVGFLLLKYMSMELVLCLLLLILSGLWILLHIWLKKKGTEILKSL